MKNELEYVGNEAQLFRVREVQLTQGKGKNVRLLEIDNNSGLHFEVNVDRGFDIPFLSYKGKNFGFVSCNGVVAPEYFDDKDLGFLKNFTAGFMTTCGLKTVGTPSTYNGKDYGLHGNYSNTPTSNHGYHFLEDKDGTFVELYSTTKETEIFENKLSLDRKIKCYYKSKKIILEDVVTNTGFTKTIHQILYHINMGYPLLSPESKITINSDKVTSRNHHAEDLKSKWQQIEKPQKEYEEVCYYHNLIQDSDGFSEVSIYNPVIKMGLKIKINCKTLDHFVEWKLMKKGDYVLGLEPTSNTIEGIAETAGSNNLKYIEPQKSIKYNLEFTIIDNPE